MAIHRPGSSDPNARAYERPAAAAHPPVPGGSDQVERQSQRFPQRGLTADAAVIVGRRPARTIYLLNHDRLIQFS